MEQNLQEVLRHLKKKLEFIILFWKKIDARGRFFILFSIFFLWKSNLQNLVGAMHLVFKFQRLFLIKWINYDKYHSLFLKQSFPYDILSPTLACSESNICTFYVFANNNAHIMLLFQGLVIIVAGVSFWFLRKNLMSGVIVIAIQNIENKPLISHTFEWNV